MDITKASSQSDPVKYLPLISSPHAAYDIDAQICNLCRDIVAEIADGRGIQVSRDSEVERCHHSTKQALLASAANCNLCRLITQELDYLDYTNYSVKISPRWGASFWISRDSTRRDVMIKLYQRIVNKSSPLGGENSGDRNEKFLLTKHSWDMEVVYAPDTYPRTQRTLDTVKAWMTRCNDHPSCTRTRKNMSLPKRVLDISNPEISLVLYESKGENVPYAALSYRWGSAQPLKTTKANIATHVEGISLELLPETLRDVIPFTRDLGFRYLWIDALCIVQDDPSDWAEQATAMTAIYHGCALNIAVADSPSCDTGVLRTLRDYSVRIGTYSGESVESSKSDSSTDSGAEIYAFSTPCWNYFFTHGLSRLETRGWVFQETLVSVASLYITHAGLVWDCCTEQCHENKKPESAMGWGHPVPPMTRKASWARDTNAWFGVEEHRLSKTDQLRTLYNWVEYVSGRYLSEPKDKLPSLAGLASRLALATSASYIAGLWKEDLPVGLTWSASKAGSLTRHRSRAPSWSWASVDGDVFYVWCLAPSSKFPAAVWTEKELDLLVLEASAEEIHPGSFGEVRGGRIEAIGTLWQGTIRGSSAGQNIDFDGPFGSRFDVTLDESRDFGDSFPCWILRITSIFAENASAQRCGPYIMFLLLEETEAEKHEFRRIGYARIKCLRYRSYGSRAVPEEELKKELNIEVSIAGQRRRITLL